MFIICSIARRFKYIHNGTVHDLDLDLDLHNGTMSNVNIPLDSQYKTSHFMVTVIFSNNH